VKKQSIVLRDPKNEPTLTLEGYTVELCGVPLVVHQATITRTKRLASDGKGQFSTVQFLDVTGGWQVSEPRTGARIAPNEDTQKAAIAGAKKRIETIDTGKSLAEIVEQKVHSLGLDLI